MCIIINVINYTFGSTAVISGNDKNHIHYRLLLMAHPGILFYTDDLTALLAALGRV